MTPHDAEGTLSADKLAELRHELRTPLNHIIGYAEMLLEDMAAGEADERQAAVQRACDTAREALVRINATLAGTRTDIGEGEITRLYDSLREPQQRIVGLIGGLLAAAATMPPDVVADLRRILQAAEHLVPEIAGGPAAADTQVVAAAADPGEAAPGPPRLLVVDDDEDNREVLRRRLERDGYMVECAHDGERALDLLAAQSFDLVLLDMVMPGIDGHEVLVRIKATPGTRDVPVIMVSALDDVANIARCIEHGAEDYLPKPFDRVLLRARISASLERKRWRDREVEYLKAVDQVIQAAATVEDGTYRPGSMEAVASRDDALGKLARVFDGMATEVRAREERLRSQVRELRGEIAVARQHTGEHDAALDGGKLKTGDRFADRYDVLAVVGKGGMGAVYRARDLELEEEIAIKTLRPGVVGDGTLLERFKTEIRLARRISHRNVVRTHDFGLWAGVYYLTMEYVEGITVRELIETRGHLGVASSLAIGAQLADSLAVAHEQGVIHRDIKPQNLLLDAEGVLKVMDFGVARLAERASALTEVGLVVGTPAYMSPEQVTAEEVDARTDLYAAGVVLYECLTGRLPFEAPSAVSLIAKVLNADPTPPAVHNPDVPPTLSALVLRLLAKRPADRVQTAAELSKELAQIG